MKKTIKTFFLAGFLAIGSMAFGQTIAPSTFVSNLLPPIPTVVTQTSNVRVSVIDGMVNRAAAFSLVFENKSNMTVTFTWTLKDKAGKAVGAPHTMTLLANSTVDYSSKSEYADSLTFLVGTNASISDYNVEITN